MGALIIDRWQDDARCQVDPDLWFARDPVLINEAKRQCGLCPVIDQCALEAARIAPWEGVWAGQLWSAGHPRRWLCGNSPEKGIEDGQSDPVGVGADRSASPW